MSDVAVDRLLPFHVVCLLFIWELVLMDLAADYTRTRLVGIGNHRQSLKLHVKNWDKNLKGCVIAPLFNKLLKRWLCGHFTREVAYFVSVLWRYYNFKTFATTKQTHEAVLYTTTCNNYLMKCLPLPVNGFNRNWQPEILPSVRESS